MHPPVEIEARSILRRQKRIDSWFLSSYGMNLYRGCAHDCAYCDGRAERYQVQGDFGRSVTVKLNAPEVLARELDGRRKRRPFGRGYVFMGGGVSDGYQPAEARYGLTRRALELLAGAGHPFAVHVLTKSALVLRDADLLARIAERAPVLVSFSLSTADDAVSAAFEPGAPPPGARLEALRALTARGLPGGVFLMPVIPLVTDTPEQIALSVDAARAAGAEFVCFGGMTIKEGRQQEHLYRALDRFAPGLAAACAELYVPGDRWGQARAAYHDELHRRFQQASRGKLPRRIPPRLWPALAPEERVAVMLDQLDHLVRLGGQHRSPWGRAARALAELEAPLQGALDAGVDGLSRATRQVAQEILRTGTCRLYERLL